MKKLKFKTEPWEHQLKALKYMMRRDFAALYTDPGTGKTKIMIDMLQNKDITRVLVVAPNKACEVWEQQLAIHGFEGQFSVLRLSGLPKDKVLNKLATIPARRKSSSPDKTVYVVVVNYEKIWRPGISNVLLRKTLGIECVICDESHRIKSPSSKCSLFLTKLGRRVQYRYLVTGTPLAENPLDVYAQYRFLDPSIFGLNFGLFKDTYENIDVELTARMGFRMRDKKEPFKNLDELREKMYTCAFYIKSSLELPEQRDVEYTFSMPKKVQKLYKEFIEEKIITLNGGVLEATNALSTVLRLQQMTSGYLPSDMDDGTRKCVILDRTRREELSELLQQFSEDEPVVIFASYTKDLKNIRTTCKELGFGYSEVSGQRDTMSDWVKGKTKVIGVQYSSGSESIDLTRARYCIYYSQTRRLALYEQSRKRIHRPGQTKPVCYYHMLATMSGAKTIDQKMYEALKQKKSIVDYVMESGWS